MRLLRGPLSCWVLSPLILLSLNKLLPRANTCGFGLVGDNIAVLPVHDAVAVQKKHKAWAEDTMIRIWSEVVGVDACEVG